MKYKTFAAVLMLIGSFIFSGALAAASAGVAPPHPLRGKKVLLDAGHGGLDAGTTGWVTGVREDTLNLAVAKALESLLEEAGATVIMTREDENGLYSPDTAPDMQKREDMQTRAKLIRESGADYVISIHMNGFTSSDAWGAQVLYQEGSKQGELFAQAVQDALLEGLNDGNRRTIDDGNYLVLRSSEAPAILVECGFLSNAQEEAKLVDESYQKALAWYIYTGLMRYAASDTL